MPFDERLVPCERAGRFVVVVVRVTHFETEIAHGNGLATVVGNDRERANRFERGPWPRPERCPECVGVIECRSLAGRAVPVQFDRFSDAFQHGRRGREVNASPAEIVAPPDSSIVKTHYPSRLPSRMQFTYPPRDFLSA